jgi:hypothetical protein
MNVGDDQAINFAVPILAHHARFRPFAETG